MTEKKLSPLRRKDIQTGRKLERDAIVAWLRKDDFLMTADAIEAGEHLK